MATTLLAAPLVFSAGGSPAQAATGDLLISEYVEGSSFNKYIEVYNGTGADVDLAAGGYDLQFFFNGNTAAATTIALAGTLADGDVHVVGDDGATLFTADQESGSNFFNGDDAIVLRKGVGEVKVVVDSFGQVGVDPGSEWLGGGQNDTLVRKASVCEGDTDPSDEFDASVEWDVFAEDDVSHLGTHTIDCGGGGGEDPVVIINEVDADTDGTDVAEFVELYDGGAGGTDLSGLTVVLYNGSDDASYAAFDLDGQSTDADGYFVICGDPANVANCDLDVSPDSNLIQNGPDAVALVAGDAADFPNDTPVSFDNLVDAFVYDTDDADDDGLLPLLNAGQSQVNENASDNKDTASNQRCPNGTGGARNTDTYAQFAPTPGEVNLCEIVVPPLTCDDDSTITTISAIQGVGAQTPIAGTDVVVDATVTSVFFNGFNMQEEPDDHDTNPATSEGIFVFTGSTPTVVVDDVVRVGGTVSEFRTEFQEEEAFQTQITNPNVLTCATGASIVPTVLTFPVPAADSIEALEGMLVTFPQDLVIAEFFNYDRFGSIVVTAERFLTPTAEVEPGPAAIAAAEAFDRNQITIDDRDGRQNPDPVTHPGNGQPFSLTNLFRGGDTITGITGVIDNQFATYRIQPTVYGTYTAANPRTADHDDVGGDIEVASFNVLNYFTDFNGRGAEDQNEFTRQRDKIISALAVMDSDIVGLIEIENAADDAAVDDLVAGLNDVVGAGTYAKIDTGPIGTDAIKVAFIYKPAVVSAVGSHAILDTSVDPRFLDSKNRPALAQTFADVTTGEAVTVVVNHFKSKGSACDDVGDPDLGDGTASCNGTRTAAAEALADWLATDPTGSGDDDVLIIGDLNSYDKEDPIDALLEGSDDQVGTNDDYVDLLFDRIGEAAYGYTFDGQIGYLDYALANTALDPQVTGVTAWNINSDEPDILDYNTNFRTLAQQVANYAPDPYRSSDHDPVIVGLALAPPPPPKVLYVVGNVRRNGNIPKNDVTVLDIMVELGYQVDPIDDDGISAADADGYDMVVISSSVQHRKVGDTFTDADLPVATWEGYLFDDLGFNADTRRANGETHSRQKDLEIGDASHQMAAGYTGVQQVTKFRSRFSYSASPDGDAQIVASVDEGAVLFGYEDGAQMTGTMQAPARRVGMFPSYQTARAFTPAGSDIIAAALTWALDTTTP